jgi:hypothetical protein
MKNASIRPEIDVKAASGFHRTGMGEFHEEQKSF